MKSILLFLAGFLVGSVAVAGIGYMLFQRHELNAKYNKAWNDVMFTRHAAKALHEERIDPVIVMLEAEAEGWISGFAPTIKKTPDSQDKKDFIDTVRQYSTEYLDVFPRREGMPTRNPELKAQIEAILKE